MTTLIVNSNRLDLIDDYHAQNKSIIIDSEKHELLFNDGTGTYSTKEQSAEDARVGDLADLTTTEKSTIVGAINEVNSGVSDNADAISSLGETVSDLGEDVSGLSNDVSSLDTRVTALEQAPAILPSYSYAGTLAGLATTDWAADASAPVADYGYKATLNTVHLQGNTAAYNESGNVYFSPADAVGGKLAPYAELTTVNYSPVTVVGNPTIDSNYVMSNQNASNYVMSTGLINFSSANTWKVQIDFNAYVTGYDSNSGVLFAITSADRSFDYVQIHSGSAVPPGYAGAQICFFVDIYKDASTRIARLFIWWQYSIYREWLKNAERVIELGYDGTNYYVTCADGGYSTATSSEKIGAGYLVFGSSYASGNTSYWGANNSEYASFKVYLGNTNLTVDNSTAWEYTTETDQRYAFNIWASEAIATGSIDYSISLLPKGA